MSKPNPRTRIFWDAAKRMQDAGITVDTDSGYSTVSIDAPGQESIFMQGDEADSFIGECEEPCSPGAGSAAAAQGSGARGGAALRCLSRLRRRTPIATGCGYPAAGVALRAVSANPGQQWVDADQAKALQDNYSRIEVF